jgi:hypothetical protein
MERRSSTFVAAVPAVPSALTSVLAASRSSCQSSSSEELEKALRVTRFDLCQRVGETAPYRILSSEEIKTLSIARPLSVEELRVQFRWPEQKLRMIAEEILRCIREHSGANIASDPQPSSVVPWPDLPSHRVSPSQEISPKCLPQATSLVSSCGVAPVRYFEEDERQPPSHRNVVAQEEESLALPEPSAVAKVAAMGSIKRRRTEALNATCGVGKATHSLLCLADPFLRQ